MEETERVPTPPAELHTMVRRRDPPPPLPSAASVQLLGGADVSMDDVLLQKSWSIHWMSRMYHFQRPELSAYAHELVKFLRDEALSVFKREFGYKVSIRHTEAFVAFEVREEREAKDAHLAPVRVLDSSSAARIPIPHGRPGGMNNSSSLSTTSSSRGRAQTVGVPPPPPSFAVGGGGARSGFDLHAIANSGLGNGSWLHPSEFESKQSASAETAIKVRRGGIVLYFPTADEDEQQQRQSMAQHKAKERQYIVLLRGHEGLLRWACAWLQQRFQCIVSEQQMTISPLNLKWLARTWVVDALEIRRRARDAAAAAAAERGEGDADADAHESNGDSVTPPLLLEYTNLDKQSMVRNYTLTVPWATLERLMDDHAEAAAALNGGETGECGADRSAAAPDLIQRTEALYFETLPLSMSAFELVSIEMAEAAVDQHGRLELYDLSLVHSVLRGLAELLCIQNVPGPASPVVTL